MIDTCSDGTSRLSVNFDILYNFMQKCLTVAETISNKWLEVTFCPVFFFC